jgi:hypothetical protein
LHPKNYLWGLYVEKHLEYVDANRNHGRKLRRVTRPKIRLFASESTAHLQEELNSVIEDLIRNKIIRNETQLFSDFFYAVLRHAKTQVEEVGFQDGMTVEFILTVPPICQPRARRIIQSALLKATKSLNFGQKRELFFVSEPETAAYYVLEDNKKLVLVREMRGSVPKGWPFH